MYQALYRTWRTKRFADVVDQDAIVSTLKRQVMTGRVAHAYLFCGSRGTGKTSMARLFARAINCRAPEDGEACEKCEPCRALAHENMDIIEIDAASNNGVDEIRDLRDKVKYPPSQGRYKVYIIDEVHMLSTGAFNALLKTLEEPPSHAVFILATTEPHRLPATVLSRCQRFDVRRISMAGIMGRLRLAADGAGVGINDEALRLIARAAEGGMRDALSLLDVCLSFGDNPITAATVQTVLGSPGMEMCRETAEAIMSGDAPAALRLVERLVAEGRDPSVFMRDMTGYLRSLLVALTVRDCAELLSFTEEEAEAARDQALRAGPERLEYWLSLFAKTEGGLRWASQPRLMIEVCLVRACKPETGDDIESLRARIAKLEEAVARGVAVPSQTAQRSASADKQGVADAAAPAKAKAPQQERRQPSTAQSLWQEALAAIKAEHGMSKVVLVQKGRPERLENGALHVVFSQADKIFYNSAVKEENQKLADAILTRIAGGPTVAAYALEGEASAAGGGRMAPTIEKAIELFGRDIVGIED